tara:strand:- start:139 stop:711 length:573 start_codon:yes stop_codon:yes gene_type:complete
MSTRRFQEFIARYPRKSYGISSDAPKVDTRLDTGLGMVAKSTEAYFKANALKTDFDDAIVCAVMTGEEPEGSSLSSDVDIVAEAKETFDLKCFVLTRPMTSHVGYENIASLDPLFVDLLPTFKVKMGINEERPKLGDVVVVKYDTLTYTGGDFISTTGVNVADMFSDDFEEKTLPEKFRDSPRYEPTGAA